MEREKPQQAVVVKDLRKSFGQQVVLDGVDLAVDRGEIVVVLGRSGTGKSILLKLIVGLRKPDSGSIYIDGCDITRRSLDELNEIRKHIGFLFQQAALYDSLTVEDNVAFPLRRHTTMSDSARKDLVHELLARVGMEKDLGKMPAEISGGMKKRVAIARALALEPDVLLFDEPTAGLDPITAEEINELIVGLQKERRMASLVVTHDLHSAKRIADRVAILHEGTVLVDGTFENLQQTQNEFVSQLLRTGL